jgi:uncharacterized protein YaeQ
MALKATILKTALTISDMDRHYYDTANLTIAQHPSETDERVMVRLLAYALHASEQLNFTKGLCADDEPELWQKNLNGTIELWIELGLPSEDRLRKACAKSEHVVLYAYGTDHAVDPWWNKIQSKLMRFEHLLVVRVPYEDTQAMAQCISNSMEFQCMIEDGEVSLASGDQHIVIKPRRLN